MATSDDIKKRALELSEKTDSNSISPKEVGDIMHDLASLGENAIRNGGTLGIRKVYASVAAMEADSTYPVDFWGNPIKKGNLVVIYDGTTTGLNNNQIYAFMNPGWVLATKLDAAYATRSELSELEPVKAVINDRRINIATMVEYPYIFHTSMHVWEEGSHYRLPVIPGYFVKIVANNNFPSRYAFLKSTKTMTPIEGAVRTDIKEGTEEHIFIPDGCYGLYINKFDSLGNDLTPVEIVLENFYNEQTNPSQYKAFTLGRLTFDNVKKVINIFGDIGIVVPDLNRVYKIIKVEDVPYGQLEGRNGYGVVYVDNSGVVSVVNYDKMPENATLLAVFRVKFVENIGNDIWNYSVEYIYQSDVPCDILYEPNFKSNNVIPYSGNKLTLSPTLRCRTYGKGTFTAWADGLAAQGMAIYNGYMFQLHNKGMVRVWDVKKTTPILINQFNLGSYGDLNHANSAQFGLIETETGFPLLYVGGCNATTREMYVEKIGLSGSELIQTISFDDSISAIPTTNQLNSIVGDDGYIWVNNHDDKKLYFAKLRMPSIEEGNITLNNNDVVDSWTVDYNYDNEVRQDICVYNGKFFFQYGGTYNKRGVKVYDTNTHGLLNEIDLTNYLSEEFEGIDVYNNKIWITTLSSVAYILEFEL